MQDTETAEGLVVLGVEQSLSLNILQTIKAAQAQHGLRHGDYGRYRQYCSKRLKRLYKTLNFSHGRGKFAKRKLEASAITDVRHFYIPLVSAERAWAYAMELKNQIEEKVVPRKRLHLIRRLRKAAFWAAELARLTAEKEDNRTALEAEAYASWMSGNLLLEQEIDWEAAQANFMRAKRLFTELAKVGSLEQQALSRQQLEEIEPTLRFCSYQISSKKGAAAGEKVSSLIKLSSQDAASDLLQSKLALLAAEERVQQSAGTSSLQWRGTSYPARSEKVRVALHTAAELQAQLSSSMDASELDGRLGLFDKLINAYGDARSALRHVAASSESGPAAAQELEALGRAVRGTVLERSLERALLLLADARHRLQQAQQPPPSAAKSKDKDSRPAKAEDLVRLYDTLLAYAADLGELASEVGGTLGETLLDESAAKAAHYQAGRCFYVGQSYLSADKATEAYALYERTLERISTAIAKYKECAELDGAAMAELEELQTRTLAYHCLAHARVVHGQSKLGEGVDALSISAPDRPQPVGISFLADNPDHWESFAGPTSEEVRLARIPPALMLVPVRPIVLDSASEYIKFPSLEHRVQKTPAQNSTFARLFGWRT